MTNRARADYHLAAQSYSDLAPFYHDWSVRPWVENMRRQGAALDHLFAELSITKPARVLDFTSGMGTQPIALALHGHHPTALDISPAQTARAKHEASALGVADKIEWITADALHATAHITGLYDVALSFGSSLPLLGSRDNILAALREIHKTLKPGGTLLLSLTDYTPLRHTRPHVIQSGPVNNADRKGVWLETGTWLPDGAHYISDVYFIYTEPEQIARHYPFAAMYALTRAEMEGLLTEAGYADLTYRTRDQVPDFSCPLHIVRKP